MSALESIQRVILSALVEDDNVGTTDEIVAATGLQRSEVDLGLAALKERGLVALFVPQAADLTPWWIIVR